MLEKLRAKKALLEVLQSTIDSLEGNKKCRCLNYRCIDVENGKWDYVPREELDEDDQAYLAAIETVENALMKLV